MGSWGYHTFEDDATCDWLYELIDADDPRSFLRSSLGVEEIQGYYLEYEKCCSILGAAETVYALLHGVRKNPPEEFVQWVKEHEGLNISDLKPICIHSLNRLLSDNSELNELWSENLQDYHAWKQNIEVMRSAFENNGR